MAKFNNFRLVIKTKKKKKKEEIKSKERKEKRAISKFTKDNLQK